MRISLIPLLLLAIGQCTTASAQQAGTFTATGSMTTPRFRHTATLLPNGKVLIAGGNDVCYLGVACIGLNTADLYDPTTGTFTPTSAMSTIFPIGGVSLPDGRVFFVESYFTGAPADVELYDPATERFNVAGRAEILTRVDSAIGLNDGRVLLIGATGTSTPGLSAAAEFYDPVTGTFSSIANWPRWLLTPVAVLVDGRVFCDSNRLYDPATQTITDLTPSSGFNDTPPGTLLLNGKVLQTGGNTDGGNVDWASLFDPAAGMFSSAGTMSTVRDAHTSTLLPDGTVLVAGGATTYNAAARTDNLTSTAEIYDPAAGQFSITGSMTATRASHSAVVLNDGRVLVTGGLLLAPPNGPNRIFTGSSSAELYTPPVLTPAPSLLSISGDGRGQGAILHASTQQLVSPDNPAVFGEALEIYLTGLREGGAIPPRVSVGGRLAEVLFFGDAPGFAGLNQINVRVPDGIAAGSDVPVRLNYAARWSNEVTIAVN